MNSNSDTENTLFHFYKKIKTPKKGFWKTFLAYSGPGLLIAVGYMDPGNWATDIQSGSQFGYLLLSVILLSSISAMFLQYLSLKLGIVTQKNLAEMSRLHFKKWVNISLWVLCEIAIIACDIAEIIGSAIALKLLFSIPILIGSIITIFDVFIILILTNKSFRSLEIIVTVLILTISLAFLYNIIIAQPDIKSILIGFLPSDKIIMNHQALFLAVGILGATVMPHNLYLHSAIAQTRSYENTPQGIKKALFYSSLDSSLSLLFAFIINCFILILAAAAFFDRHMVIDSIENAYKLISPALKNGIASTLFALALLAAGQNSSITGTLAGQIVMEGFLNLRIPPYARRFLTRLIAIFPVIIAILILGEKSTDFLLVLSQVVLSLQLPFAIIPLIMFTSSQKTMGEFKNNRYLNIFIYFITFVIISLNFVLILSLF